MLECSNLSHLKVPAAAGQGLACRLGVLVLYCLRLPRQMVQGNRSQLTSQYCSCAVWKIWWHTQCIHAQTSMVRCHLKEVSVLLRLAGAFAGALAGALASLFPLLQLFDVSCLWVAPWG